MKQHFFMLLAAVLLSSTSAFAQSENNESVKGDVNGDGRVDIVDVTTVIDIYLNTDPDAPQTTTYYWYVGQTNPSTMTSISPIVNDNTSPGWRLTGNSLTTTYNYDTSANPITGTSKTEWYFALPENSGLGVFDAQNTNYATGSPISTVTIGGIKYNIWNTGATRSFNAYYIKNK